MSTRVCRHSAFVNTLILPGCFENNGEATVSRRVLAWLYCVAATVVLVVLIAQLVFLAAVLLSVVQLKTP